MSYIDMFVAAVPTANREKYKAHAERMSHVFREHGAVRVVETWSEDVSHGKVTDFYRAVQAKEDESIVVGWIEWPDKAARDSGMAEAMSDERMKFEELPFDGKRMIFGGFDKLFEN